MKKYVVTGGAGFIGSALVRALLERGSAAVSVVDNLNSGKEANLKAVLSSIEFHHADIRDANAMTGLLKGADTVFHLAAIPSVKRSIDDPVPSHDVNINGTFTVLRAAHECGVRRVVYASSSSVYGDTPVLPKVESMLPRPKSPYAAQKLMGEYYCSVFASCFGLETVALRFFNVFGPRQDPFSQYSGVLSVFVKAVVEDSPPTIHGDGEQSRDFTYVEDVAALVIRAALAEGASGKAYNGGNGGRYSLNEVWKVMQEIAGTSLPARYGPSRAGDVRDSQADTTAVRDLGHSPRFSLEQGLRETLQWYRSEYV